MKALRYFRFSLVLTAAALLFTIAAPPTPAAAQGFTFCSTQACTDLGRRLTEIVNFLAALVGITVVGSIVYGGILYSSAADNPQKLQAAKDRIRNAIIALIAFIFLFSFLQWLVPGGLF